MYRGISGVILNYCCHPGIIGLARTPLGIVGGELGGICARKSVYRIKTRPLPGSVELAVEPHETLNEPGTELGRLPPPHYHNFGDIGLAEVHFGLNFGTFRRLK